MEQGETQLDRGHGAAGRWEVAKHAGVHQGEHSGQPSGSAARRSRGCSGGRHLLGRCQQLQFGPAQALGPAGSRQQLAAACSGLTRTSAGPSFDSNQIGALLRVASLQLIEGLF